MPADTFNESSGVSAQQGRDQEDPTHRGTGGLQQEDPPPYTPQPARATQSQLMRTCCIPSHTWTNVCKDISKEHAAQVSEGEAVKAH